MYLKKENNVKVSTVDKINIGIIIAGIISLLLVGNLAGFFFAISALAQTIRIIHMQSQQGE